MLPFQLAIYVINEMLNMIRMHSILMIEDYIYIWILNCFYGEFIGFYTMSYLVFSCMYIVLKMKLGRTGYLMGFIRTYAHR